MLTEAHMKAVMQAYIDGFNARDADALIALFADDATVEDPVGSELREGIDAIASMYRQGVDFVTSMSLAAPIRGSHTNAAAMAFDFEMNIKGATMQTSAIDVMEFNDDGKIQRMRAYWGPGDARALG